MLKYYKTANRQEFYKVKHKEQKGLCAICKNATRLVVDHCHKTGLMRGLLCYKHNMAIGFFADNPELLRDAASYLELHQQATKRQRIAVDDYKANNVLIVELLNDLSFPSDRARSRRLAELTGCNPMTAQTRIRRAAKLLRKDLTNS